MRLRCRRVRLFSLPLPLLLAFNATVQIIDITRVRRVLPSHLFGYNSVLSVINAVEKSIVNLNMLILSVFESELRGLEEQHLLRHIISRGSSQGPVITIGKKKYLNFSSNDYLGLSGNPEVVQAAHKSLQKYGFGSGASRLLAGGSLLHKALEERISRFKGTASALIFNSGYSANTGVIPSIASEADLIFSDELNHASIIDGCRLSRARTMVYRHNNITHLQALLKKSKARRRVVITDTVFSMDGDLAPLRDIYEICVRHGSVLYLDDAHGTGVLGRGRGALEHFGLKPEPWLIQMGTFSKALGSFGAFVAGSEEVIKWVSNTARSFLFSTALPSPVIAAAAAGLRLVERNPGLLRKLWSNRERLYEGLKSLGYNESASMTPILTVRVARISEALGLSKYLFGKGIYVPAIRPPTVIEPRLRITVTAAHTERQIDRLLAELKKADIGFLN
jgi:8-amino-7-oxononanoate synthase